MTFLKYFLKTNTVIHLYIAVTYSMDFFAKILGSVPHVQRVLDATVLVQPFVFVWKIMITKIHSIISLCNCQLFCCYCFSSNNS